MNGRFSIDLTSPVAIGACLGTWLSTRRTAANHHVSTNHTANGYHTIESSADLPAIILKVVQGNDDEMSYTNYVVVAVCAFVLSLAKTSLSASIELFHESTQRSPKEREVWSLSAPNITDDRSRRVGRETIKKTHFMFLATLGGIFCLESVKINCVCLVLTSMVKSG